MAADCGAVMVEPGIRAHEQVGVGKATVQAAFHAFDGALLVQVEHIPAVCVVSEVRELLVRMEMVVAENDIIQPILFNLFFQPGNIVGEVFAFQPYLYPDLLLILLSQMLQAFDIARQFFGKHTHIGYVVGTVFPGSVV